MAVAVTTPTMARLGPAALAFGSRYRAVQGTKSARRLEQALTTIRKERWDGELRFRVQRRQGYVR
jgi:hypothetical protein